jgi:hypothetical protein
MSKNDDPQKVMDCEWPEMGMYYIISYSKKIQRLDLRIF